MWVVVLFVGCWIKWVHEDTPEEICLDLMVEACDTDCVEVWCENPGDTDDCAGPQAVTTRAVLDEVEADCRWDWTTRPIACPGRPPSVIVDCQPQYPK